MNIIEDVLYNYDQINLNNLVYNKIDKNKDTHHVYVQYMNNKNLTPLLIVFPSLYCFDDAQIKGKNIKIIELLLTLSTKKKKDQIKFLEFIHNLQQTICNDVKNHEDEQLNWFKI